MKEEKRISILEIVKEDILEMLGRESKEISIETVGPEITVSLNCVSKSINDLEKEGLIKINQRKFISLTEEGLKKSEKIIKKHTVLEDYFKRTKSEKRAWKEASVLEHYVSMEVIDNIKKLSTLRKKDIPLTFFKGKQGLVIDIVSDIKLFERIVSMGIFPGEIVKIISWLPTSIVIEVGNKKFALAKEVADKIKVIKEK
jgi:Mn-dependent DtxR family transcriptional regulator